MKHYHDAINADTTHKQGQMNGCIDFDCQKANLYCINQTYGDVE